MFGAGRVYPVEVTVGIRSGPVIKYGLGRVREMAQYAGSVSVLVVVWSQDSAGEANGGGNAAVPVRALDERDPTVNPRFDARIAAGHTGSTASVDNEDIHLVSRFHPRWTVAMEDVRNRYGREVREVGKTRHALWKFNGVGA